MATEYDAARQDFLALFPRRDAFIWKAHGQERWQKTQGPLLDSQIIGVVSDEGRGLFRGCYWSHKTRHAVLDIDIESRYHNAAELQRLRAHLSDVGLYVISYQSSESGGWHLYLPFDDWADSDEVNQTLKRWLKTLRYEIKSGQLEIFPSGNALRLPLQKGFAWLNPDGSIKFRREEITENEALASFLQDFDVNARNWEVAKSLIESQTQDAGSMVSPGVLNRERIISLEGFDDLFFPGLILDKWQKGRQFWLEGLTEKDQRHEALLAVGHYLWYGDATAGMPAYPGRFNDQARARLIRSWLEQKHNGLSGHVARNNWQAIESDLQRAVSWRRLESVTAHQHLPYGLLKSEAAQDRIAMLSRKTGRTWSPEDWKKGNDKREKQARRKIQRAVAAMCTDGAQLTRNAIAERSGCSPNTVSKHRDLWVLLASRSGDISRGVWGVPLLLDGCNEPIAVLTGILTAPEIGFEEKEKTEIPLCSNLDSGDLEAEQQTLGLSSNGTRTYAKSNSFTVAPLPICPANSQPESTQHQVQALRVATQDLTPGPLLSGIRAEGQMCAGGISFIFQSSSTGPVCYTDATASSIKERVGAASEVGALVAFGTKSKNEKIIPDATNYRFLTTGNQGYPSSTADKIDVISSRSVTYTDPKNSSWTSVTARRPTFRLRGPPGFGCL